MHRNGSSVMFPLGSQGVVLQHQTPPRPNDPVGIDLTLTLIPAANPAHQHKTNDHRNGSIHGYHF